MHAALAELEQERRERQRVESQLSLLRTKHDQLERRAQAWQEAERRERERGDEAEVRALRAAQQGEAAARRAGLEAEELRAAFAAEREELMAAVREAGEREEALRAALHQQQQVQQQQQQQQQPTTTTTRKRTARETDNGERAVKYDEELAAAAGRLHDMQERLRAGERREAVLVEEVSKLRDRVAVLSKAAPQTHKQQQHPQQQEDEHHLAAECLQWRAAFASVANTPTVAGRRMADYQRLDIAHQLELGEAHAKLVALDTKVGELKFTIEKLERDVATSREAERSAQGALAEARRRCSVLEGERDAADRILRQYAVMEGDASSFAKDRDSHLSQALDRARAELAECQARNDVLEKQIKEGLHAPSSLTGGGGPTTRVLHVRPNSRADGLAGPPSLAGSSSATLQHLSTPLPVHHHQQQQLQTVEQLEKKRERLKEMFQKQIVLYKEAVYLLLGVKVDMTPDPLPQLRVRSMYAESPDDALLFRMDPEKGTLELLQNSYASSLDQGIFAYLSRCDSVPAFLATLTLDLFERQTFRGLSASASASAAR